MASSAPPRSTLKGEITLSRSTCMLACMSLLTGGAALYKSMEHLLVYRQQKALELQKQEKARQMRKRKRLRRKQALLSREVSSGSTDDLDALQDETSDLEDETPKQDKPEEPLTHVAVTSTKLNIVTLSDKVRSPCAGAVVTFSGTTRNSFEGKKVVSLEYEAYVSMAEKELLRVCDETRSRWPEVLHLAVEHRIGNCPVGETSVIIAVSAPHRAAALDSARFALDTLKARVPIWKKEVYSTSAALWKENKEFFDKQGPAR